MRIQLADSNYLSLAEVRVLGDRASLPGPPPLAGKVSWVGTGISTDASALSAVNVDDVVHLYQRGLEGRLYKSLDAAVAAPVPGSPSFDTQGVSAVFDPATKNVFVAGRATDASLMLGQGRQSGSSWTWENLGTTDKPPSLVVAGGRIHVAGSFLSGAFVKSRLVDGTSWLPFRFFSATSSPTALAVNSQGRVGLAYTGAVDSRMHFIEGSGDGASWDAETVMLAWVVDNSRPGLVSYGPLFAIAGREQEAHHGLFAVQTEATGGNRSWGPTEVVGPTQLLEAPELTMFRGTFLATARDTAQQAISWMRDPNAGTMGPSAPYDTNWYGGSVVGGWGVGATRPVVVAAGKRDLFQMGGWLSAPDELFVFVRGIDDRQIYGLGYSRFVALAHLSGDYHLQFLTDMPVNHVPNLWDQLAGFMMTPRRYRGSQAQPTVFPSGGPTTILEISTHFGEMTFEGCDQAAGRLKLRTEGNVGHANYLWQEWGHMLAWGTAGFKTPEYFSLFEARPKACSTLVDCMGANPGDAGWCDVVVPGSAAERVMGQGATICYDQSPPPRRMQGFVTDYDVDSNDPSNPGNYNEHSFIGFVTHYRWMGDTLREWVARDLAQGNDLLRRKYDWVRDAFYGGQEFNGRLNSAPYPDESLGTWGRPLH